MGNFEKLSVLVIVVIIVMILVVALYTWTGDPSGSDTAVANVNNEKVAEPSRPVVVPPPIRVPVPPKPVADGSKTAAQILKEIDDARIAALKLSGGITSDPLPTPPLPEQPVVKEPRFHTVLAGETVGKVAKIEYPGVSQPRAIDGILKANPTVDPSRMAINTKLLLPDLGNMKPLDDKGGGAKTPESIVASIKPGSTYVTKKGDSLKNISLRAYRDGNQWHRIWVENFDEISDTDHLQAGTRLRIPIL